MPSNMDISFPEANQLHQQIVNRLADETIKENSKIGLTQKDGTLGVAKSSWKGRSVSQTSMKNFLNEMIKKLQSQKEGTEFKQFGRFSSVKAGDAIKIIQKYIGVFANEKPSLTVEKSKSLTDLSQSTFYVSDSPLNSNFSSSESLSSSKSVEDLSATAYASPSDGVYEDVDSPAISSLSPEDEEIKKSTVLPDEVKNAVIGTPVEENYDTFKEATRTMLSGEPVIKGERGKLINRYNLNIYLTERQAMDVKAGDGFVDKLHASKIWSASEPEGGRITMQHPMRGGGPSTGYTYRMFFDEDVTKILDLTNGADRPKKAHVYIPEPGQSLSLGKIKVTNTEQKDFFGGHVIAKLTLEDTETGKKKFLTYYRDESIQDFGTPAPGSLDYLMNYGGLDKTLTKQLIPPEHLDAFLQQYPGSNLDLISAFEYSSPHSSIPKKLSLTPLFKELISDQESERILSQAQPIIEKAISHAKQEYEKFRKQFSGNRVRPGQNSVTHCSAGKGRTGTELCIERMTHKIQNDEVTPDNFKAKLCEVLYELRYNGGIDMVQKPNQWQYVVKQCREILDNHEVIKSHTYQNIGSVANIRPADDTIYEVPDLKPTIDFSSASADGYVNAQHTASPARKNQSTEHPHKRTRQGQQPDSPTTAPTRPKLQRQGGSDRPRPPITKKPENSGRSQQTQKSEHRYTPPVATTTNNPQPVTEFSLPGSDSNTEFDSIIKEQVDTYFGNKINKPAMEQWLENQDDRLLGRLQSQFDHFVKGPTFKVNQFRAMVDSAKSKK